MEISVMYTLRPLQKKIIDKLYIEFSKGRKRILLMGPTGIGKTVIAKTLLESSNAKGNKALFTVPKINLIEQTAKYFNSDHVSIVQGDDPRFDPDKNFQIATLQTLNNRKISDVKLVIFDEVHFAHESKLIQSVFERYSNAYFIGLSATPVDDRGYLLEGWDCIIDDFQLIDVINEGDLTPIESYACLDLDLSNVSTKGNDYNADELEPIVSHKPVMQSVLDNYIIHANGKKFICFCVNKKHAAELCKLFNDNGIKSDYVCADTPIKKRNQIYKYYSENKLIGLFNVEILTAGYDEPSIECGIMAVPTKSWRKYIQCVGRIVRKYKGKEKAIFLDCGNNIQEHGLPTDRKKFIFKTKISRTIDRELNIDTDYTGENINKLSKEKIIFLKKIGSLLDLYEDKVYRKENDLQDDVNSFLKKTGWFWWRQNSGKMFKDGRWIHFASKSGLPDCTMFFNNTPIYVGIELKLLRGRLTDHQQRTLPEMIQRGCLLYFAESVADVWHIIKHIETHIEETSDSFIVKKTIYKLPERQKYFYKKYNLLKYVV